MYLDKKQNNKKMRKLNDLKKEIKHLEFMQKHINLYNAKMKTVKNLKIAFAKVKFVTPYVLVASTTFIGATFINFTPFVLDNIKKEAYIKKEIDNTGNITSEKQYEKYDEKNILLNYSEYRYLKDDFYVRDCLVYDISDISIDEVKKIFKDPSILNEKNVLKKTEERTNNVEDVNKKILKAIVYEKDSSDFIMVKEDMADNVLNTILYFVLTIMLECFPLNFQIKKGSLNLLREELINIKEDYKDINDSYIKLKLKVKYDNYNRLNR